MPTKPKALILSGYGLNCQLETAHAFTLAGADADIIHINQLISSPKTLDQYQILAVPGGFSFGDDTGSGNAYALKLKNHLFSQLTAFIKKDKLIIGICNGFQILINLGLLPAIDKKYGDQQASLNHNSLPRYSDRWVDLKISSTSPWLSGIKKLSLPIAHGEGSFYAEKATISQLKKSSQIAATYTRGETADFFDLPANPNGSLENIAAITDPTGRILGLMPHPERAIYFTQLPNWTSLKIDYLSKGKNLPRFALSLQLFQNATAYFN